MDKNREQEIAEGLQQGKGQAWQQLYEEYCELVWNGISRLVGGDSAAVEDIVQETFLAAARSAGQFNPACGCLWVWLWTIARRQVALYRRTRKPDALLGRAEHWWADLDGEGFDWIDSKVDMPPDILQSQELAALVRYTLRQLPPDCQMVLLAKYVDNESTEHIAGQMNCSQTAVRSRLVRARRTFRKTFKKAIRRASDSREELP